jgi:hypothetical protein
VFCVTDEYLRENGRFGRTVLFFAQMERHRWQVKRNTLKLSQGKLREVGQEIRFYCHLIRLDANVAKFSRQFVVVVRGSVNYMHIKSRPVDSRLPFPVLC